MFARLHLQGGNMVPNKQRGEGLDMVRHRLHEVVCAGVHGQAKEL